MAGIPPVLSTDDEDVAWALQTADALWKRNERLDAIVWLRRAAQAAGEAQDDDRALSLARNAAELADRVARASARAPRPVPVRSMPPAAAVPPPAPPTPAPPPRRSSAAPAASTDAVDELLRTTLTNEHIMVDDATDFEEVAPSELMSESVPTLEIPPPAPLLAFDAPAPDDSGPISLPVVEPPPPSLPPPPFEGRPPPAATRPKLPPPNAPRSRTPAAGSLRSRPSAPPSSPLPAPVAPARRSRPAQSSTSASLAASRARKRSQSSAALQSQAVSPSPEAVTPPQPIVLPPEVSAAPQPTPPPPAAPSGPRTLLPPPVPPPLRSPSAPPSLRSPAPPPPTHVPSAAEAHAGMLDPWAEPEARTRPAVREETPEPAARAAQPGSEVAVSGSTDDEVVTSAPPVARTQPSSLPPRRSVPPPPVPSSPARARASLRATPPPVDLSGVDPFGDLPDDARESFALEATVRDLVGEEETSGFALALVIEGSVDVTAALVDAPVERLQAGAVLRSRGTIDHILPIRLVGASARARIATWDEGAVAAAFRTCPWVEDDLRAAGDRIQALAGVTMGPLGTRFDARLRTDVTSRLRLRALADHEIFATRGQPVPGLLLLGAGEVEMIGDDGRPNGTVIRPGEFLFANEVLRAGPAPSTVRAAKGGALILSANRAVSHELLLTYPPLLEVIAGM